MERLPSLVVRLRRTLADLAAAELREPAPAPVFVRGRQPVRIVPPIMRR